MASGEVDLCLIPELPIVLDGPGGCLPFLFERVKKQGNALVVVAEGAGEDLLGKSATTDAGGNRKLPPIGVIESKTATFGLNVNYFGNVSCRSF
jgi:6-phosphofructokinase 1